MIRLVFLLAATATAAADPPRLSVRAETRNPPADLKPAVRDLLESRSATVSDPTGPIATFWLRKAIAVDESRGAASYRRIAPGTLIGVVHLARPWIDFKSQEVPAGVYTLRLALQPDTKDHEGTAPHRDFCLLVPFIADPKPEVLTEREIVKRSGTATGGTHPVVMLLQPHPDPAADPVVRTRGKWSAIGVRGPGKCPGFAFTIRGTGVD